MTEQEYKFETNSGNKRYYDKWFVVPIVTFFAFETVMIVSLVISGHFTLMNFALSLLGAVLSGIMPVVRMVFSFVPFFRIEYKYYLTISDCLNRKKHKFDFPLFSDKGIIDKQPCEELTMRWKNITSCKMSKLLGRLTIKDSHGKKIVIAKNYKDYHIICKLVFDRVQRDPPYADIEHLEPSTKDFV
jgi:hypothetical protein